MTKRSGLWPALLFAAILWAAPAAASERGLSLTLPSPLPDNVLGTYHALIIGINDYQQWNPLQTAVNDATALRDVLVEQYGFPAQNVLLRTDEDATRLGIIQDLRSLASGLEEQDNLLIYYAGHGQLDDLTGDGYWIPAEGLLKNPGTWISHGTLKGILGSDRVRAKNVVIIADSCYSGTLLRGGPSVLELEDQAYLEKLSEAASRRSRQVITSGGLEPVADGGRDGHSLFAYYLITALRENSREVVDLENLFHTRIWNPVTQIGDQRPNVGRLKTPMDEDGQFVLRNQGLIERKAKQAAEEARKREEETARLQRQEEERKQLQAERARLEVEQKRLEEERRLLEERKRLEAERLELEREKQRLAMEAERRSSERGKAVSEKPAAPSKPPARVASLPPPSSEAVHTMAIFPWHFECRDPFWKVRRLTAEAFHKRLLEFFEEDSGLRLTHSFYEDGGIASRGIQRLGAGDVNPDTVWEKPGVFSNPEPSAEVVYEAGKKLGVDLVLMIRTYRCFSARIYVFDVRLGKMYRTDGGGSWTFHDSLYLQTTKHLKRCASKNPPG